MDVIFQGKYGAQSYCLESSRKSYEKARQDINDKILRREPFSLIRIGDGESVILGWERGKSTGDLESHLRLWFANYQFADHELRSLQRGLVKAIRNAHILGVPTTRQVALHSRYEISYSGIERLVRMTRRKKRFIVDAAIHRFLHLSGDLMAFLHCSEFIGLITCRQISSELGEVLKPKRLALYLIPGEAQPESGSEEREEWYPRMHEKLLREVHVPYRGAPFLVGGGVMGKLICEQIRLRGGIAIDIGSVFDGWAGIQSRAYLRDYPERLCSIGYSAEISQLSKQKRLERLSTTIREYEPMNKSLLISEPC